MSWSIVCTTNAPATDIARFAAHHLSLGCSAILFYLDAASDISALERPQLSFQSGAPAPDELHKRQMVNAARAYAEAKTDWIAHLDIDEFLIPDKPLKQLLEALPESAEWASIPPVEPLTPDKGSITLYKRSPRHIGKPRAILEEIYPDYGLFLRSGFLGYDTGKPLARTGLAGAKIGIHKLLGRREKPVRIDATLAHHHAVSWERFAAALSERLGRQSYRTADRGFPSIASVLEMIQNEGGESAVRQFFETLRAPTAGHLAALETHGLLLQHDLQLDQKARTMFPEVFESESR